MSKFEIQTDGEFRSLHATEKIRQGETILALPTDTQDGPDVYSVEAFPGIHIDCSSSVVGAINHSCYASAAVKDMKIVAWKCIEPGEEITINYRMTESHLSNPFKCKDCGNWMEW